MKSYTVTLTDAEDKAMLIDVVDSQMWIDNAVHNKARQCEDRVVIECSDKQPHKITRAEKDSIIMAAEFKTAKQRQEEHEAAIRRRALLREKRKG